MKRWQVEKHEIEDFIFQFVFQPPKFCCPQKTERTSRKCWAREKLNIEIAKTSWN